MEAASTEPLDGDTDEFAEAFFSQPPHAEEAAFEEWELRPMRRVELLAMQITLATVTCSVLCALGLLLFY